VGRRLQQRIRDDRGTAASIVLFPLFAVVAFVFVQAAFWQQDRQLTTAAADRASAAVALYGSDPSQAQSEAVERLERSGMTNVVVTITAGLDTTTVIVTGTAPGILVGTSSTLTATSVTPNEGFRAP
jgi:Flp pilus assembly protein TadG